MGWVKLDDNFFRNPKVLEVSGNAKLLYLAGLCYAGASLTDGFIPKNAVKSLAADADITAGMRRAQELVEAGLWVENPRGYSIHDYLEHNTSSADVREKREQARLRMQRNRSQDVRANNERSSQDVREPETETETEEQEDTPHTPQGGTDAVAYSAEFETFMAAYPKRVGKGAAWKAWQKLRPSRALQSRMIEAVKAQATWPQWQRENGKYIPNPATWINQARWDDEPPQAASNVRRFVV